MTVAEFRVGAFLGIQQVAALFGGNLVAVLDLVDFAVGANRVKNYHVELADGDTLFVNGKYDTSGPQANCICPTTVSFNVRYEDSFAQATWVKYDDLRVLPLLKGTKN